MRLLDLFSGIGGFSLAASWVWGEELEVAAFVEIDKFCQRVLWKHWPDVPIVEDVNDLGRIVAYAERFQSKRLREPGVLEDKKAEAQREGHQRKRLRDSAGSGDQDAVAYANQQRGDSPRPELERRRALVETDQSQPQCGRNHRTPGTVDLVTGGVPCQPASCAGKRKGKEDSRWLWPQALAVVDAVKPRWVIFENPTGFLSLNGGLEYLSVLAHLEDQDYWTESFIIPASAVGAPHRRDRVWIVANTLNGFRESGSAREEQWGMADKNQQNALHTQRDRIGTGLCQEEQTGQRRRRPDNADCHAAYSKNLLCNGCDCDTGVCARPQEVPKSGNGSGESHSAQWHEHWYATATRLCRVDDGLPRGMDPDRVNRLRALGNSIVPQIAAQIMRPIKDSEE